MNHDECRLLFNAGKALIEKSGLAKYDSTKFVACEDGQAFEDYWKSNFDSEFGRYMAWVLFVVGAENLAKATFVCNGLVKTTDNTTLNQFTNKKKRYFERLSCATGYGIDAKLGYKCLKQVRDRDAHSYRKDKRDADFPSAKAIFEPAFNVLLTTMELNGHPLH